MFRLPSSARGAIPPTSQVQRSIPVHSEIDLRAAINAAAARAVVGTVVGAFGTEIVIDQPILVSAPIVIPATTPGLVIRSIGNVPITAKGLVSSLFEVHAPFTFIRELFVFVDAAKQGDRFAAFIVPGEWLGGVGPNYCRVHDVDVDADQFYVDAGPSFSPNGWHIRGCRFTTVSNAAPAVHGCFNKSVIADSEFFGCTDAIKLKNLAGAGNRFHDNSFEGANVNTAASTGFNTIVANTGLGAGSAFHATDAVGLNA